MRVIGVMAAVLALMIAFWPTGGRVAKAQTFSNDAKIALMDNCDVANFPPGICVSVHHRSDVGGFEFLSLLYSPLIKTVVGHPSWRMDPSYLDIRPGQSLHIANNGADTHTFTEVANFGGGVVPGLNGAPDPDFPPFLPPPGTIPLTLAPECAALGANDLLPPGKAVVLKPSNGLKKYQCCIHPWMRAVVGVGN